jgi:predicted nucleotidyltransferase
MAGNALAHATAALPISRAHADRQLKEFLARVETVNADESWPHRIGKVVLFGSYLSSQESVGDIDLAIRLERRAVFADHWPEAVLARADAATRQGRRFRGFLDRLAWAEKEVKQYLRGGKRVLSLHDWTTEEPWLQHAPHRVLFEERTDAPSANSSNQDHGDLLVPPEKKRRRPRGLPF